EVRVQEGERVRRGDTLLVVEGNESMRTYPVTAPIDGVVLARHTSVGDVTGDQPLLELADLSQLWVDRHACGAEAARVRGGQPASHTTAPGDAAASAGIRRWLPLAPQGQGVAARVQRPDPGGEWRPGMTVSAEVALATREVPLAVKESALQSFRDFPVV